MAEIPQLYVIGLLPDQGWLSPAVASLIEGADVLAGGDRLLEMFPSHTGEKLSLTTPLEGWLNQLRDLQGQGRRVVVLASGDPNYFGIAKKLLTVIDKEHVTIVPTVSTVQQAFARLKVSYERAEVVSMHGREAKVAFWAGLYRVSHFEGSGYLAVYTDAENSPSVIAKRLLGRGQQNWRMHVFEDLGTQDERVTSWSLYEAKLRKFSPLNLVILECLRRPASISLGMPEGAYVHEAGLITKREVRVVTLGLLELLSHHTMWDLGAGSGSVSIEAAALLPYGSVWSVEKSPLRTEQISANRAFFGAAQVEIVEDEAMSAMAHLPTPDRIFIGGGGTGLSSIIPVAAARLNSEGIMVVNAVSLDNFQTARESMKKAGLDVTVTQIQVARSEPLAESAYLKPLNQVWLVRGVKS
ncbi:bifunctional cobalt-precorrin-7 (C(5))-methyltransferase/cobalt-precorrin-6B (C(15))-methyltransferase [Deltaproteobacteria bacterium Smac51]|nr:bifunctional cobalt-precorrin-7 (C(5))-methyltransferase/cobalt-precorrin-6B (C(15))-methyltransferase [Deltaproteobacteria bacterium Smac51]